MLEKLEKEQAPWALVTSCTRTLLEGWLKLISLPRPQIVVAAEDVVSGKPDPACYSLARQRCGLNEGSSVLVVEDAPAGIRAGKSAGCMVLALATTHSVEKLVDAGADWIASDLEDVHVTRKENEGWRISVDQAWDIL